MAEFNAPMEDLASAPSATLTRKSTKWGCWSPAKRDSVFDNDDLRFADVRLRILQVLAFRADEAGGVDAPSDIAGATWSTEVKDHLPDGQACVHVFKDGQHYGFVARNDDELDAVFATILEATAAARETSARLGVGQSLTRKFAIVRL